MWKRIGWAVGESLILFPVPGTDLTKAVVNTIREDGNFKGSWDPVGAWGEDGGRVYSTAILVLTLEAYYRYTKLVR